MKVLVAVTDTKMGGITTSAVNFCNELSKRCNDVYFLDMSSEYLCESFLAPSVTRGKLSGRSRFWNLGKADLTKGNLFKRILLSVLGALKKITNKTNLWNKLIFKKYRQFGKFDVAIAFRQCAPCYSFVLDKVEAKKKIGFVHGELKYMGDISSWRNYMMRFDKIAYVSNAVRNEFIAAFPELKNNATTIYNMFNIEKIRSMAQEDNPCAFDPNKKNIVTVARIDNEYKRIFLIPQICRLLQEKGVKNFHWYIVGDGPDFDKVNQLIKKYGVEDDISMLGAKKNPFAILKDADFSVLPSKSEAYPMTVIESFILGVPIVVSRFASIEEMMIGGKHGLISDSNEIDLTNAIFRFLTDEALLNRCRNYIKAEEYSNEKGYEQFLGAVGEEECFQ